MEKKTVYSLIVTVVNRGFSDEVMAAARSAGAKGGTILNAHGANIHDAETFFGISIRPERELVLIISDNETRPDIMREIVKNVGTRSEGEGITFSIPVSNVEGIGGITPPDV